MIEVPLNSDWFDFRVKHNPDSVVIIDSERTYTYSQLNLLVNDILNNLKELQIKPKERIAIIPAQNVKFIALVFALWKMDLVPVLLNGRWTEQERVKAIKLTGARLLIFPGNNPLEIQKNSIKREEKLTEFNQSLLQDAAVIIFTSGTTAFPKGVVISFKNLYHNAILTQKSIRISARESWLVSLPFYHIGGFAILTRSLILNNVIILTSNFSNKELFTSIEKFKPNFISLVPTQLKALLNEGFSYRNYIKGILLGGSRAPNKLIESAIKKGLTLIKVYGSTETTSFIAAISSRSKYFNYSVAGRVIQPVKIKIQNGQIIVNSPTVANGYYNMPEQTADNFSRNEFKTADIGEIKGNNLLYVYGRRDEVIISGGENINPSEVTEALLSLGFIKDAFVFALKDSYWGDIVSAAIVSDIKDTNLIKRELKKSLSGFKVPKLFLFLRKIPRNKLGKVNLKEIMEKLVKTNISKKSNGGKMEKIIVYLKPTCTTSRKAVKYLTEKGIDFEKVNYYEKNFSRNKLKTLLKKMGIKAEDLLRRREKAYKQLDIKNKKYTQAELIELMVNNPDLIERPIIEKGEKAVLARPIERIDELL